MSVPTNPHDALFRALLEDPQRAETLIREYLPKDIASLLSDQAIELVDGTFIDEEFRISQSEKRGQARFSGVDGPCSPASKCDKVVVNKHHL